MKLLSHELGDAKKPTINNKHVKILGLTRRRTNISSVLTICQAHSFHLILKNIPVSSGEQSKA